MTTTNAAPSSRAPARRRHPVDEVLPPGKLAIYGLQHVLAFYAGAVIVPILLASAIKLTPEQLGYLINADLFTCGIASIIQALGFWRIGVRLPLLQGRIAPPKAAQVAPSELALTLQLNYLNGVGAFGLPVTLSALLRERALSFAGVYKFTSEEQVAGHAFADVAQKLGHDHRCD